jgi:L-fuculose-phosphate aldolase
VNLFEKYGQPVTQFLKVCQRLASDRYVTSHGGNLAWKLEQDLILITPTRMYKGDLRAEDLVFVDPQGKVLAGNRRPTGEMPMYIKFFQERPDIVSVLHAHPPALCALAILHGKNWLMRPLYPETVIEIGPVPLVPYGEPLTEKLADNFSPYLPRYNSFIMENHGLVTLSREDIELTSLRVEMLESTAQSILMTLAAGQIKELGVEAVRDLENTMKTRNLTLSGAPGVNHSLVALYFEGE